MTRQPETDDTGGALPPRAPRWVWVSAIVVGALLVVAVVVMLASGGQHGPGMHMSMGTSAIAPE